TTAGAPVSASRSHDRSSRATAGGARPGARARRGPPPRSHRPRAPPPGDRPHVRPARGPRRGARDRQEDRDVKSATSAVTVTADGRYGYLDLTDELRRAVKDAGITDGMAVAFCAHTTCALLINEWEDGALADFARHL